MSLPDCSYPRELLLESEEEMDLIPNVNAASETDPEPESEPPSKWRMALARLLAPQLPEMFK